MDSAERRRAARAHRQQALSQHEAPDADLATTPCRSERSSPEAATSAFQAARLPERPDGPASPLQRARSLPIATSAQQPPSAADVASAAAESLRKILAVAPEGENPALTSAETPVAATSGVRPPPRVATRCVVVTGAMSWAIAGGPCAHLVLWQYFPTADYRDEQVALLTTQLVALRAEIAEKEALWRATNADCRAQITAPESAAPPNITREWSWISTDSTKSPPELSWGWGPAAASAGRNSLFLTATVIAMGYSVCSVRAIKRWCSLGHAKFLSQASTSTFARVFYKYYQTTGDVIECWVSWFVRVFRARLSQCRRLLLPQNTAESCTRVSDEDSAWRRSTYVGPGEVEAVTLSSASTNRALVRWQERRANVEKCGLAGQQRADAALEEASVMKDRVLESILVQNTHLLHARNIANKLGAAAGESYHVVQNLVTITSTLTSHVKDLASHGHKVVAPSSAGVR